MRAREEDTLQRAVVGMLALYENMGKLRYFAVPNGGKRKPIEAAIMKGLGVRAGVPDLCVLITNGPTLFFELKSETGRVSGEQKNWADWLNTQGFDCRICRTVEEVHETVKWGMRHARSAA